MVTLESRVRIIDVPTVAPTDVGRTGVIYASDSYGGVWITFDDSPDQPVGPFTPAQFERSV